MNWLYYLVGLLYVGFNDSLLSSMKPVFVNGLRKHNLYRAKHGSLKLKFSLSLTSTAQNYATYLTSFDVIDHSAAALNGQIGENLYRLCKYPDIPDFQSSIVRATDSWYDENSMYDFKRPGRDERTYHFTALVWSSTREVGFGVIAHRNSQNENCVTVVANYYPPGNVASREDFYANVKRPLYK